MSSKPTISTIGNPGVARETEAKPKPKERCGRPRKIARVEIESEEEAEDVDSSLDSLDDEEVPRTRYVLRSHT